MGSLGVDVFFVISGYVITQGLMADRSKGWADYLLGFYARRIRRLLPALLLCVLTTVVFMLFLTSGMERDVYISGGLSLLGLSNVYLYSISSDYFSVDALLNPFTHTWSLGVEEQFYFMYPALIALCGISFIGREDGPVRARKLLLALGAGSLAFYVIAGFYDALFAFYMVVPRFWEFFAGGVVCIALNARESRPRFSAPLCALIASISLFVLLLAMLCPPEYIVICTVLAVLATAVLIFSMRHGQWLHVVFACGPVVFVGLISYSLYLWHWPVLVIGKYVVGDSLWALFLLLALAVFFALIAYYFVEKPLRYSGILNGNVSSFVFLAVLVLPISLFVAFQAREMQGRTLNFPSLFGVDSVDSWAGEVQCHGGREDAVDEYAKNIYVDNCLKPSQAGDGYRTLYLLGDSHAAQFTFMLQKALPEHNLEMRFVHNASKEDFPRSFLSGNYSSATFDTLLNYVRAGDIVMIAMHRGRLNDRRDMHIPLSQEVDMDRRANNFQAGLQTNLDALLDLGVKVILVRDTPLMSVVASSEACKLQKNLFGKNACRVSRTQDVHTRQRLDIVFDGLSVERGDVYIWDPSEHFFSPDGFADVVDSAGEYIMMDAHHITRQQSEKLAPAFIRFLRGEGILK